MLQIRQRGTFKNTERFFKRMSKGEIYKTLSKFGDVGVAALSSATPKDTGNTADLWDYTIERSFGSWSIFWENLNENQGVIIAVILQYGHGTGTGGYVQGRDYINPAIRPVFDAIADSAWKEVTSA